LVIALNVVVVHVADGEKVICALGAELLNGVPFPVTVIVELVKLIVAPVLGTPFAMKLALNHTQSPEWMGVPLKFDEFVDCAVQLCAGGVPQVMLIGENWMLTPLCPDIAAVPEKLKLPFNAGNEPMTVPVNVAELAVNGMEPAMGRPAANGELSIV
jgi:hypothetical protein